jgi:predicted DNA-binding WGR domain protein
MSMPTFEFCDGKYAKFWSIELAGKSFTVRFGKIGTAGLTQTKKFADETNAKKEYDKLVADKVKKGYVEVGAAAAPSVPASKPPVRIEAPERTRNSRASAPRKAPPPTASPAPVDSEAPTDSKQRTFELRDDKSAKFWSIELEGNSVTVCFGKIGTAGLTQIKKFADETKARKEHDKLIAEKVGKGYVEIATTRVPVLPLASRARVGEVEASDLEAAWLTSRSSNAAQAFAKHINDSGGWAAYTGDAVFVEAPLPAALREAVTIQKDIAGKIGRCGQGKRLVDILLFRVVPAEPFRRPDLPVAAFDSLYSLLLSLSKVGGIQQEELDGYGFSEARRGLPAIAPGDFPFDMDEVRSEYGPMPGKKGQFRFRGANYDTETSARVAAEFFGEIERQRGRRDELLESGIAELRAAGLFGEGDPLFVHWLNDDAHGHGFLTTPWELYVGQTHALVVVREGTWF